MCNADKIKKCEETAMSSHPRQNWTVADTKYFNPKVKKKKKSQMATAVTLQSALCPL